MESFSTETLIEQALQKPEADRARIAEKLIASLDGSPDMEVEKAWQDEITRRVREGDAGEVKCVPWEEIRERLYRNAKTRG